MAISKLPVLASYLPSVSPHRHEYQAQLSDIASSLEDDSFNRSSPAKGALLGILLGTGFWATLLLFILKH